MENVEKLLHLEFEKKQEERNNLTLWIGIITVVFLIFSFYSMLKSDDLVKQSKEGLRDIKSIKKDAEEELKEIKKDAKEELQDIKDNYYLYTSQFESYSNEALESKNQLLEKINDIEYDIVSIPDYYLDKIKEEFEDKIIEIERRNTELSNKTTEIEEQFKDFNTKINGIKERLNNLSDDASD